MGLVCHNGSNYQDNSDLDCSSQLIVFLRGLLLWLLFAMLTSHANPSLAAHLLIQLLDCVFRKAVEDGPKNLGPYYSCGTLG